MKREEVNFYIRNFLKQAIEYKEDNDVLYIKFDFLPYEIRSFIHSQPGYQESKMKTMPRDCNCGVAAFYEADSFYSLMENFKKETNGNNSSFILES